VYMELWRYVLRPWRCRGHLPFKPTVRILEIAIANMVNHLNDILQGAKATVCIVASATHFAELII